MGYYTTFYGEVSGPDFAMRAFMEDAESVVPGAYEIPLADFCSGDILGGDSMKWYGYESDMLSLSNKYPALLFSLRGEGEESGDMWKAWFRNGESLRVNAVVTYPEPDLDKELPGPDLEQATAEARLKLSREKKELLVKLAELDKELDSLGS